MAFLTLKGIGKIYVSDGNVSVGIRGVDLSFNRGEFVAVTGSSGSGKSTLLNVISGMDTYEEGELFIEGSPTSHYQQPDWEAYREKYISFVFQDYNIIESYTVLENVELALMNIPDPKERRRRALDLLARVGMSSHVRQKGSKLSGGQKQRTVIARALAKDSPIILADEPTGNLDAETSREIIALLREVSRDKLLIVVTHNFEQVEEAATRHVRIYDGAVESDETIRRPEPVTTPVGTGSEKGGKRTVRNGILLGSAIFKSTPRLSLFLVLLLLVGTLAIFLATSLTGNAADLFAPTYMFRNMEGRVIVARRDGNAVTAAELADLKAEYNAANAVRFDYLYDDVTGSYWDWDTNVEFDFVFTPDNGKKPKIGRSPEAFDEVHLYLPIGASVLFDEEGRLDGTTFPVRFGSQTLDLKVTGITYFYNNTKPAELRLSESGMAFLTAARLLSDSSAGIRLTIEKDGAYAADYAFELGSLAFSDTLACNEVILSDYYHDLLRDMEERYPGAYSYSLSSSGNKSTGGDPGSVKWSFDPIPATLAASSGGERITVSPSLLISIVDTAFDPIYLQASLFFPNDRKAEKAADAINSAGYLALLSDETYSPDPTETILNTILLLFSVILWIAALLFFSFFIGLCCSKSIYAFRGDMSIMRSMGIPVRVIRIGMYVRMILSLIPALVLSAGVCALLYLTPKTNAVFPFLAPWQFTVIVLGMVLLALLTTRNQVKRLFSESVKKSLKGGDV